jgi:uncharacterized protein
VTTVGVNFSPAQESLLTLSQKSLSKYHSLQTVSTRISFIANLSMTSLFRPLTNDELQELNDFLLYELQSDESMTLDILDGYLHAIAIGPTSLPPRHWLPGIWGEGDRVVPFGTSIKRRDHILSLIKRRFDSIIAGLEAEPKTLYPRWWTTEFDGKEYDDAEGWAYGFCEGMKLCWSDWRPLLESENGQAWYRPIALLGGDDFSPSQDALTKTPAMRSKLALQIPGAVVAIYEALNDR